MVADRREHLGTGQRPGQQRIDEGAILIRQLGERQSDLIGNGTAGGQWIGKGKFVKWVGVAKGLHGDSGGGADFDNAVLARDRRARQHQLLGERCNLLGPHLARRFPVLAITV